MRALFRGATGNNIMDGVLAYLLISEAEIATVSRESRFVFSPEGDLTRAERFIAGTTLRLPV
jgi:hypothetical protein